ncbi:DegT/DnrJ/EryC1/StrS family aminotransferase [Paenibacillus antri]|uniref:DegT/DnrJ/EryC1/StrS family aminotransferase n=1 Tax=Paenibacillus antri TaxID=2582848 RepID=A0A5R9GBP2_9BACL|nr:DegT/DnrJ/EryC1/StrS family aminotransferase [Paenibacillus antri]TLS53882.1 DegT/DnrJ/EryC1/StrS family aminotransferase [Paenibacillus antri]
MSNNDQTLAIHGGTPVRKEGFAEWPIYDELEEQYLLRVLHSSKWGGVGPVKSDDYSPMIPQAEKKFAELHDADFAVACCNGTVALTIALQAAGVRPGDEVIVPPYTFIATAFGALAYGVIPVFADIDENTLLIDPEAVERAVTPKTRAVIAVHIAGAPADLTKLKEVTTKHGLVLIEDAAQAVGAEWEGRKIGAIGDIGTFSFQSSKNLNSGEGGMIVTNSRELWERVWSIVNVGRIPGGAWYQHELVGQNYRITEFQAAILLAQMTRLEEQMQIRESRTALLDSLLSTIDGISPVPAPEGTTKHAHHLYMLTLDKEFAGRIDKDEFIRRMNAEGIPLAYGYVPLNQNRAILSSIREWTGQERYDACPVCEELCAKRVLWLHQNVLLSDESAIEDIAKAFRKVIASYHVNT